MCDFCHLLKSPAANSLPSMASSQVCRLLCHVQFWLVKPRTVWRALFSLSLNELRDAFVGWMFSLHSRIWAEFVDAGINVFIQSCLWVQKPLCLVCRDWVILCTTDTKLGNIIKILLSYLPRQWTLLHLCWIQPLYDVCDYVFIPNHVTNYTCWLNVKRLSSSVFAAVTHNLAMSTKSSPYNI